MATFSQPGVQACRTGVGQRDVLASRDGQRKYDVASSTGRSDANMCRVRRTTRSPAAMWSHSATSSGAGTLTATTGATTKELMKRLGHSGTRATMIYQHATKDRDKTIADGLGQLARDARPTKANRASNTLEKMSLSCESGRRESNPHDQLGRSGEPMLADQDRRCSWSVVSADRESP
jgi:hypothetical protein